MIVSFDDLYINDHNNLDKLFYLKGKYPLLKVNMFCVPNRSTWKWLENFRQDWIGLYMHGWNHLKGERLNQWMVDEWLENMGTKIYKSPWYKNDEGDLDLLFENDFLLVTYPERIDHFINQYVLTPQDFRGHLWKDEDWDKLEKICQTEQNFELI